MRKLIYLSLCSVALLLGSCRDFVSKDDISPNEPGLVPIDAQLPVPELSIFTLYGGSMARNASMFVQQMSGISNQSQDYSRYRITEADVSNDWSSIYSSGLTNTKELITKSGDANPHYRGIARIQQALLIGICTDFWGNVPYRQAGQGIANLTPGYDRQEQILQDIQSILDSAIADLQQPAEANTLSPFGVSLIFQNTTQAIQTARILKARYHIRLTKRDATGAANAALADLAALEAPSSANDAYMIFGENGNESNQFYAFEVEREQYMRVSEYFVDTLRSAGDPRLPLLVAENGDGQIVGAPITGGDGSESYIGAAYASQTSPLPLVTYAEALFIRAEAHAQLGQIAEAEAAYQAGIRESMARLGLEEEAITAYLTAHGTLVPESPLPQIMYEKYVQDFLHPEAWADWRRTGYPELQPNPDGVIDEIPRRYVTEQRERINNPNARDFVVSDLDVPVWWDGGQ